MWREVKKKKLHDEKIKKIKSKKKKKWRSNRNNNYYAYIIIILCVWNVRNVIVDFDVRYHRYYMQI